MAIFILPIMNTHSGELKKLFLERKLSLEIRVRLGLVLVVIYMDIN